MIWLFTRATISSTSVSFDCDCACAPAPGAKENATKPASHTMESKFRVFMWSLAKFYLYDCSCSNTFLTASITPPL